MSARIRDVLTANLVLVGIDLLTTTEAIHAFRASVDSEVALGLALVPNVPTPDSSQERTLTLSKDRISLTFSSARSVIQREYPTREGLTRLAEVAGLAIANTQLQDTHVRAFGYNVELIYDQDSGRPATEYLAHRLFPDDYPQNPGWDLTGGSAKLTFRSDGISWIVTIEPRFNDINTKNVFLGLNLHRNEQRIPETEEIRDSLETSWDQAIMFVKRIDDSG